MSDQTKTTEAIMTTDVPLEIEGALEAPTVFFEEAPLFGTGPGIGRITLSGLFLDTGPDGTTRQRRRAIAHLRGSYGAFASLRQAINELELMLTPPPDQKPN